MAELMKIEDGHPDLPRNEVINFTEGQIKIIREMIAKNLTDDEFQLFIYVCKHRKLNPLTREIYAIKRGNQMTIQTGIDGFRLIAERTGKYSPGKCTQFSYDENGKLIAATAFVKKYVVNEWHEVSATAFLNEYQGAGPMWNKMPSVMLEKVAESRALRRAFPSDLSGLYTTDEMSQSQIATEKPEVISQEQVEELERLFEGRDELKGRCLKFCGVSSFEEITLKQYETCIKTINVYVKNEENDKIVKEFINSEEVSDVGN